MRRLALLTALGVLCACKYEQSQLPSYNQVPEFKLTAQDGQTFDSRTLAGKVWVADFIFTHCPGPCPRMTSQMHQVQEATFKMPGVHLVSFTIDPDRDTAPVLESYAKQHHANPERWTFLTGTQATLNNLARNVFLLNSVDGTLVHSTRFVLVDATGRIRSYYETNEPGAIDRLVADIHRLARNRT